MDNGGLDQDRIRQLQAQSRGEEPIEATPDTGFHPDQLNSYPLQRIGPRIYSTDVEAVALTETPRDYILVEASEMEDYSHKPVPEPEDFADSRAWYSIRDERNNFEDMKNSLTRQGQAVLRYVEMEEYFDDQPQISEEAEYGPNVVFETNRETNPSLHDWRKLLDNSFTTINLLQ